MPTFSLISRGRLKRLMEQGMPATRPMDNMHVSLDLPQEEEIALANTSHLSFVHSLSFPTQIRRYFDRYVMMRGLTATELKHWEQTYLDVVRKATFAAGGKRIVQKSPPNLARVRHLLKLFPDARFIHIMHNPYVVYQSVVHLYRSVLPVYQLEDWEWEDVEAAIVDMYAAMMRQYMQDRAAIPAGQLVDVRFEDLEADPMAQLERIYTALSLPGWADAKGPMGAYLQTLSSYRKNRYALKPAVIDRVNEHWRFAVDAWNYQPPDRV